MFLSLLTIDKDVEEEEEKEEEDRDFTHKKIQRWPHEEEKEEGLDFMPYKATCSLCEGNGYITIMVEGKDEIKQCWLCESKGEKEYSQAAVDKLIYETYYKNERKNIDESKGNRSSD